MSNRLKIPDLTLCAATSVNVDATIAAMQYCTNRIEFGDVLLLTDADLPSKISEINVKRIPYIGSSNDYSMFMIKMLHKYVRTSHCLVVQWDGHLLDLNRWQSQFLEYDYIGARWPQFDDGKDVGNGGFSLRSRRLLEACATADLPYDHPEDLAIGRGYREQLEAQGFRFAPGDVADMFSTERASMLDRSFGYHGVFNMPQALGSERFWQIYRTLDSRGSVWHDFWPILFEVLRGARGWRRAAMLMGHRLRSAQVVKRLLR